MIFIGVITAGGFAAFLRARPKWLTRKGRPQLVSPPLMLVILAWHLLVTPALARLALWLAAAPTAGGTLTLRDRALQMTAIQGAAALVIALWYWLRSMPAEKEWIAQAQRRPEAVGASSAAARPVRWWWAVVAAVLGLLLCWPVMQLAAEVSAAVQEYFTTQAPPTIAHRTLREIAAEPTFDAWMLLLIVVLTVLVPWLEETVFRGAIQGCLRGLTTSPWPAIVVTALAFGLMHLNIASLAAVPGLVVFGIALGVVYERTGTLLAPVLMHGLFNMVNIALILLTAIARG